MDRSSDNSKLLNELRIDRNAPEPGNRKGLIAGGVIALVVVIGALAWWRMSSGQRFSVQTAVAVQPSSSGPSAAAVLQATGYVTARRQATVSAQITGKLIEVLIEEGERVAAGQVLARLEATSQRSHLAEAQAQLAQTRAQIAQVDTQLAQAKRDYTRQQELVERKLVSRQAEEAARTQVEALTAQRAAQDKQVELAQAQLQSAQVQVDYTTVRAPFAGVVVAKSAQVGEIVSPLSAGGGFTRTGIGTIVDMDSLEIEVDVNEAYIERVKPAGPAQAVLDAYPSWTIPAQVIAIIPTADRSKATVKVRVALKEKDPRILPDMGARVSFLAESAAEGQAAQPIAGVLLPASAVVEREGKSLVFVIDKDRVSATAVKPGQNYADLRQVEGIAANTRVVREPPPDMQDGARIEIQSADDSE